MEFLVGCIHVLASEIMRSVFLEVELADDDAEACLLLAQGGLSLKGPDGGGCLHVAAVAHGLVVLCIGRSARIGQPSYLRIRARDAEVARYALDLIVDKYLCYASPALLAVADAYLIGAGRHREHAQAEVIPSVELQLVGLEVGPGF